MYIYTNGSDLTILRVQEACGLFQPQAIKYKYRTAQSNMGPYLLSPPYFNLKESNSDCTDTSCRLRPAHMKDISQGSHMHNTYKLHGSQVARSFQWKASKHISTNKQTKNRTGGCILCKTLPASLLSPWALTPEHLGLFHSRLREPLIFYEYQESLLAVVVSNKSCMVYSQWYRLERNPGSQSPASGQRHPLTAPMPSRINFQYNSNRRINDVLSFGLLCGLWCPSRVPGVNDTGVSLLCVLL